jgi:DNA helicase-2/ATP-dependent DNA helicase PcrA
VIEERAPETNLSPAQDAAVRAAGNVFVDAGPGTGKTHVIVARIRHLASAGVDPRRILVVTFSRRAAAELRDRVAREAGIACEIRTFHGFASRVLEAGGPRFKSRRLLDAFTESLLLDAALEHTAFASLPASAVRSERFRADVSRFIADVRRADAASVGRLRKSATPRLRDLLAVYDRIVASHDVLRASDLDDLIARTVAALADASSPSSLWLAGRYDHVLIDEFQDVDAMQLELVGRLDATLFAVGDAAQAIYAFRGALAGVIDAAIERFAMRRFELVESRRCPQVVCDLAARTPLLETKPLRSLQRAEGSVVGRAARTTLDEAALIADRVEDAIVDGVVPARIAVLMRSMQPLGTAVEAELRSRNIPVAGGGRNAFLADRSVEAVRLGLRLLADPSDATRWPAFLTAQPLGFDGLRVRSALTGRTLKTLDDGLDALAAAGLAHAGVDLADTLRVAGESFASGDIGRAARRLINGLGFAAWSARSSAEVAIARADVGRLGRVVEALTAAQRHLRTLDEPASSSEVLSRFERRIDAIAAEETPADDVPGVRLLTIHGAKGLEFDLVVIGDAVDGRFPSAVRRSSLLDDASLEAARDAGVDLLDARDDASLREEASLWYVGVTRTRCDLFVTYAVYGADAAPQRPTRFLPPSHHPAPAEVPFERRLDRYEDRARESGDAAVIATLRASLVDSPALVALLDQGDAAFAPLPERPVTFTRTPSVSGVQRWLECPRRFYYGDVLGLRDEPSLSATLGTALHAVLAAFHSRRSDFTDPVSVDAERYREELQALRRSLWPAHDFGAAAKVDASARFADRVLDAYARALASEATTTPFRVVACERPVASRYGSEDVRGQIDRVDETTNGTLVLRDYKSGRRPNTTAANALAKAVEAGPVAGDIPEKFRAQLMLYRRGAEAAFGLPVSRLEYVYLNGVKSDETTEIGRDAVVVDDGTIPKLEAVDAYVERDFILAFSTGIAGPIETAEDVKTCRYCSFKTLCPKSEAC